MIKHNLIIAVDEGFSSSYEEFLSKNYVLTIVKFSDILKKYDNGEPIGVSPDLLVFTGGADVDPEWYGESKGKHTHIDTKRDEVERRIADIYYHVPKLGICRGSQFLTVLAGGKLIQHVSGHATGRNHKISLDVDLNLLITYEITSTHHQMMYPYSLSKNAYNILAYSRYLKSDTYLNGDNEEMKLPEKFVEPEIVYYPGAYALAIQGHPELSSCPTNTKKMCLSLIDRYLVQKKN